MKYEISFSGRIKEELSRHISDKKKNCIAEITAIVGMCGKVSISSREQYSLKVRTENISVARKYFTLLQKTFNIEAEAVVSRNRLSENVIYTVIIQSHEDTIQILRATRFMDEDGEIQEQVSLDRLNINHYELAEKEGQDLSESEVQNMENAKVIGRKKSYVVYLKEGSQIVDLLNVMEAPVALMEMENVRILKEMRNMVNRKVNCETANISKTVNAAVKQLEDIVFIRDKAGLDSLPDNLREIALLRLENPDAPLKELGTFLDPPVGKSGVNHRLRRISEIAETLRE